MFLGVVGVGGLSFYTLSVALPVPLDWRSGTNRVWPRMVAEQSTFNAASLQRSGAQPPGFCYYDWYYGQHRYDRRELPNDHISCCPLRLTGRQGDRRIEHIIVNG